MADEKKPPASDNNSADNPAEKPGQSVAPGKKAEATKKETKAGSTAEPRATDALSDKEKELVAALRAVWSKAAHQLCQMHFMQNLSEPVHREDQKMRQTVRDRLYALPAIPDLKPEEAEARIEHLVSKSDASGEKRVHR